MKSLLILSVFLITILLISYFFNTIKAYGGGDVDIDLKHENGRIDCDDNDPNTQDLCLAVLKDDNFICRCVHFPQNDEKYQEKYQKKKDQNNFIDILSFIVLMTLIIVSMAGIRDSERNSYMRFYIRRGIFNRYYLIDVEE